MLKVRNPYAFLMVTLALLFKPSITPLEFLQRLAALVPRPRLHLIRFHGVA